MPEDGSVKTARLHGSASLHLRTLKTLHDSLFAPQFRALENYGRPLPPPPCLSSVIAAAKSAAAWHRSKEVDVAAELAARRAANGNPAVIDETARTLAYHREERARIEGELAALGRGEDVSG